MFVSAKRQSISIESCMLLMLPLRMYLRVDLVVFTVDSASSCFSSAAFSDASRWLAP